MHRLLPPREVRMTKPGGIRASRRGQRWLVFFLASVVLMLGGAAWLLWPMAAVTVEPVLDRISVSGAVVVDTGALSPVAASGIVPGYVLAPGEHPAGYRTVTARGRTYAYRGEAAEAVVQQVVLQVLGGDYVAAPPWGGVQWAAPRVNPSGTVVTLPFMLQVSRYHKFNAAEWRSHIAGMAPNQAKKWLESQPGVAAVRISLYPEFFAKVRQKIPSNQSLITIALDIAGKTSILE